MTTGEKIRITKELDGIIVRIKPEKDWSALFFILFTLAGWTFGGILFMNALSKGEGTNYSIVLLFLAFWLVPASINIFAFLWNIFGEEIVSIRSGLFTRKLAVGGLGIKKTFRTNELFNLRPSGFFDDSSKKMEDRDWSRMGLAEGTVAVDTKYETLYRFGIRLEESESLALAKALEPYLPSARYLMTVPLPDRAE